VAETLAELATRHRLILMTKGNHAEQADKVDRSGLANYFSAVEIAAEKDPTTYREVLHRHELAPHTSWMIGNSPKSDINPHSPPALMPSFFSTKTPGCLNTPRSTPRLKGSS